MESGQLSHCGSAKLIVQYTVDDLVVLWLIVGVPAYLGVDARWYQAARRLLGGAAMLYDLREQENRYKYSSPSILLPAQCLLCFFNPSTITIMYSVDRYFALAALAALVVLPAQSTAQNASTSPAQFVEPCKVLAEQYNNNKTQFAPSLVIACGHSIPLDVDTAASQVRGLQLLVQFASTRK
jgi:hypothetical protein